MQKCLYVFCKYYFDLIYTDNLWWFIYTDVLLKKNVLNCDSYMVEIFIFFLHNVHAHIIFKLRFYAPL